jgi:hypothetical protein
MTTTDSTTLDGHSISEMWGDPVTELAGRLTQVAGSPAVIALVSAGALLFAALRLYLDYRSRATAVDTDAGSTGREHATRQRWMLVRGCGAFLLAVTAVLAATHVPWAPAITDSVDQPGPILLMLAALVKLLCGPILATAIVRLSITPTDPDHATPAAPRGATA